MHRPPGLPLVALNRRSDNPRARAGTDLGHGCAILAGMTRGGLQDDPTKGSMVAAIARVLKTRDWFHFHRIPVLP